MLFDTHVHLNDSEYEDYDKIIQDALKENVTKMVVIGFDYNSSKKAVDIANRYPFIYAAIGIHPSEDKTDYHTDLIKLEKLISNKVVAIGEIGLDYHYLQIDKKRQEELFVLQLKLAKKYNLPICIHSRDACQDTYRILKENKDCYNKGIMHCYSYSKEMANKFSRLGFIFGIGGVVTYKNAKEIKDVVENLDLSKIVLETDAPYLAPTPFRGKVNEPKYIGYVAKEIAILKNLSQEKIEEITYKNACDFFEVNYEN